MHYERSFQAVYRIILKQGSKKTKTPMDRKRYIRTLKTLNPNFNFGDVTSTKNK